MTTMAMRTTKAIGFMSKQIALHVHHIFWYLFIDVHGSKITKKRNPKRLPFVWKNPEIPGRIFKWNDSSWRKYSGKKVIPNLSKYYLFPVFTETTEIFCTIYLDY